MYLKRREILKHSQDQRLHLLIVIGILRQKHLRKLNRNAIIALKALVVTHRIVFEGYIVKNSLVECKYR